MDDRHESASQITFGQELLRKATHMGALIIPGGYYLLSLSKIQMLSVMVPVTILMILIDISRLRDWAFWRLIGKSIIGPMVRGKEVSGNFTGATYILLSVCCVVAMFDKPIAIAALAFIIVGDTLAALVGRKLGRHRFGQKSIEGSAACLVGTVAVAFLIPQLPFVVGICGAIVATVVEALSTAIDDNISVPVLSGLAMTLLTGITAGF